MDSLFIQRLIHLCKEKKLKPQQLRYHINVQSATITKWTKGELLPNPSVLIKLSQYFNCSTDYLLGLSDVREIVTSENLEKNIPPKDKHILDQYHHLTPNNKSIVDYIFGMEDDEVEPTKICYFPVFFQSAAAGIGQLSETNDYQMEELKLKTIPKEAKFGMYIVGNSMETDIYENDIVLIDPSQTTPDELDGAIVVARFGEELVCKTLSVNIDTQTYDFTSNNSGASDKSRLNQKQGSFRLVGKVVRIIHANIIGEGIVTYHDD